MDYQNNLFSIESYYYNVCHWCKAQDNLKVCVACKTVAYCSKQHQIDDWIRHKSLCKAITITEGDIKNIEIRNFKDFRKMQDIRQISWQNVLKRKLIPYENHMWMFPKVCTMCYSKNVSNDYDCSNCRNASYCSKEHKMQHCEQHKEYCASLKLCMQIDTNPYTEIDKNLIVSDFPNDVKSLPKNIDKLMECYDPKYKESSDILRVLRADIVAPTATILYGLEQAGLLENRICRKSNLTIHIVGAGLNEMIAFYWEIFSELPFHWIQNLDSLDYFVIGPELKYEQYNDKYTEMFCQSCKSRNVSTSCYFHSKLYHNVVASIKSPDVVVCFNSGLHEFHGTEGDLWKKSINCLTNIPGVPLLLTAYTLEEIIKDVEIITENISVGVINGPHRNPFSNMKPIRDFDTEGIPVFYQNGYIALLIKS